MTSEQGPGQSSEEPLNPTATHPQLHPTTWSQNSLDRRGFPAGRMEWGGWGRGEAGLLCQPSESPVFHGFLPALKIFSQNFVPHKEAPYL